MNTNKVQEQRLITKTCEINNAPDTESKYAITANVRFSESKPYFESGIVADKESQNQAANFSGAAGGHLSISFQPNVDKAEVVAAIEDFMQAVEGETE